MAKKYIYGRREYSDDTLIYEVTPNTHGVPRYMVHLVDICLSRRKAIKASKRFGFSACRKEDYYLYFICATYGGFDEVYRKVQQAKEVAMTM
nr:MAG TPA: hypothetical protein [Bacteriophage sp.]